MKPKTQIGESTTTHINNKINSMQDAIWPWNNTQLTLQLYLHSYYPSNTYKWRTLYINFFVTFETPIINPPIRYQQLTYSSHSDTHTLLAQKWFFIKMNDNISNPTDASNINSNLFQLAKFIKVFHLGIMEKPICNRIHKRSRNLTANLGTRNHC